jgi:hypothetical protein
VVRYLQRSRSGKLYVRGKNIVAVFSPKREGVVIVVMNSVNNANLGYVFLTTNELEYLLRDIKTCSRSFGSKK